MSSSSVDGVCAMLNHATTVLEQDYREVLYTRLRYGFPSGFDLTQAYNFVQSSLQQGKITNSEDDIQKNKAAFLVSLFVRFCIVLNNLVYAIFAALYFVFLPNVIYCCAI